MNHLPRFITAGWVSMDDKRFSIWHLGYWQK